MDRNHSRLIKLRLVIMATTMCVSLRDAAKRVRPIERTLLHFVLMLIILIPANESKTVLLAYAAFVIAGVGG
ncbi:MAG: hypothetical protein UDP20_03785 [Prevotella sp.]|nr:hypothetical protein [Prevotella sp.]